MAKVELWCAVYGEATVLPVEIARDATVSVLQEVIARFVSNEQHIVPPRLLTLYLARKNGEWLKADRQVKSFLRASIKSDYEEMWSFWKLKKPELFGPNFELGDEEIHVLVELPEVQEAEVAVKKRLERKTTGRRFHAYYPDSKYFLLEKADVKGSGLGVVSDRLMLYCRPAFHYQFEFLRERVLEEGHLGWILGPPGMGKSVTSMAFTTTLDRTWVVAWIHVGSFSGWRSVRLVGNKRRS